MRKMFLYAVLHSKCGLIPSMNENQERMLVFCLSVIAYSGVATAPFMYDDIPAIKKNPDVQGTTSLQRIWCNDFWGVPITANTSHKSYRPLTVLTFRLIRATFGDWSTPYHVTNILLHASLSAMFTSLCRRMIFRHLTGHASLLAGVLFSLHPIHTEAVSGIVGMAELLSAFFVFSALLLQSSGKTTSQHATHDTAVTKSNVGHTESTDDKGLRFRGNNSRCGERKQKEIPIAQPCQEASVLELKLILSLLLSSCAMLCKESGLTVLALLTFNEIVDFVENLGCRSHRGNAKRLLIRISVLATWCLLLLWFRMWVMEWTRPVFAQPDNPASYAKDRQTRFLTYCWLCCVNLWLLLFPLKLCYDWSYDTIPLVTSLWDVRNVVSFVLFTLLVAEILRIMKRSHQHNATFRSTVMGISLLVLPFLPASNLFFPVGFVVAERVLYLPSSGFIVLLSLALTKGFHRMQKSGNLMNFIIFLIIAFYGIRTVTRNQVWTSRELFMSSGVKDCPNNAKVHYNWGNYLYEHNRTLEAAAAYQMAIDFYPRFISAMNNLATILEEQPSTMDKAHELYVRIIHLHPLGSNAYNNYASLLLKQGKYDDSYRVIRRGLELTGVSNMPAAARVARSLAKHGKLGQAEHLYQMMLGQSCLTDLDAGFLDRCEGANVTLINDFALMLEKRGELKNALKLYAKIVKAHPTNTDTLVQMANCFASMNMFDKAEETIFRAVKIDPDISHRAWELASSVFTRGKLRESMKMYERVVPLIPDNLEVAGQYAAVLFEAGMEEKAKVVFDNLTRRDEGCKFDQAWRNYAGLCGKQRRFEEGINLLKTCSQRIEKSKVVTSHDKARSATVRLLLAKHEKLQAYRHKESGDKAAAKRLWIDAMHNLEKVIALDPTLKEAKQELDSMRG